MSNDNIINLGGNRPKAVAEELTTPNNTYKIFLNPTKTGEPRDPVVVSGYLALTGSFFAVAQGDQGGDIKFVAPVETIDYITEIPSLDLTVN